MGGILGTSLPVFIGVTCVIIGFAAYMTGQAMANTWKPQWQLLVYGALLGLASRFLIFSLFDGELLSVTGYAIDTAVLVAIGGFAFRLTRARKIVNQYPWLYERNGLFGWKARS
jgi:uncharacterized membrane protein HdeD (DUF308 family)